MVNTAARLASYLHYVEHSGHLGPVVGDTLGLEKNDVVSTDLNCSYEMGAKLAETVV